MAGDADPIRKLRHDLANPLGALLTEIQLLLMDAHKLDTETIETLHRMEAIARQMKDLLAATRSQP